jgi:hypothetical protein
VEEMTSKTHSKANFDCVKFLDFEFWDTWLYRISSQIREKIDPSFLKKGNATPKKMTQKLTKNLNFQYHIFKSLEIEPEFKNFYILIF